MKKTLDELAVDTIYWLAFRTKSYSEVILKLKTTFDKALVKVTASKIPSLLDFLPGYIH